MGDETLIEERSEQMVSPSGGKPCWRFAHFLKPSLPSFYIIKQTPNSTPFLNPTKPHIANLQSFPLKVNFYGWKCPPKQWSSWVDKLRPSFEPIWKKSFINQAITASTFEIPRYNDLIFALVERFCPETNTFLFPWGECTITLEDVMVLGGYSVTGDSVLSTYHSKQLCEIEDDLHTARMDIIRSKSKKVTHHKWVEKWMGNGDKFEHEAFLSLWLSRCVLPCEPVGTIDKKVFPIAVLLAKGTKIALAPAVLASIYRDLRLLKENIGSLGDQNDGNVTKLNVFAPLLLLQLWVWERFPTLSPKPNPITNDQPRSARWQKVSILKKDNVGFAIDSAKQCFVWRPYSTPLNNWSFCVKLYPEKDMWVLVGSVVDLDLQSYVRCIRVSELVGLNCIEQYLPHRVAMQFGFDQDVPMVIPRFNSDHEIAWSNYNRPIRDVYMPSRLFESDVTLQYLLWWKNLSFVKGKTGLTEVAERLRIKLENNEAVAPPGFSPSTKRVIENVSPGGSSLKRHWDNVNDSGNDSDSKPSSKRFKALSNCCGVRIDSREADASHGSSPQMEGIEGEDESDCDHLTLTQLFHLDRTKRGHRDGASTFNCENPSSSAGDNATIRERKSWTNHKESVEQSDNSRRGSMEEEIESNVESPVKSPMSTNKKEDETSSRNIELVARIARLQRIVNILAKLNQS